MLKQDNAISAHAELLLQSLNENLVKLRAVLPVSLFSGNVITSARTKNSFVRVGGRLRALS